MIIRRKTPDRVVSVKLTSVTLSRIVGAIHQRRVGGADGDDILTMMVT